MDGKFLEENLNKILKKIGPKVKIIGASKFQPVEKIKFLNGKGVYAFAENYVQEFLKKKEQLTNVNWHFIGPLQSNKIKNIVGEVELIQSVGRLKEAEEISKRAIEKSVSQQILLEINIASEDSKHGFAINEIEDIFKKILVLKNLKVIGLMCMPPLFDDPNEARPYFKKLKTLASDLGVNELSMGTSQDFEIAVEEGATMIRLGEILFGARE